MKKIILIRHGKANSGSETGSDFDRKLNEKGHIQANVIGHLLKEKNLQIDQIISSDAIRTSETIQIISQIINFPSSKINFQDNLYLCGLNELLQHCFKLNEEVNTVVICGHNNGISDCLNYFTEADLELSTCGTAILNFKVNSWKEISKGLGAIEWMKLPQEIVT